MRNRILKLNPFDMGLLLLLFEGSTLLVMGMVNQFNLLTGFAPGSENIVMGVLTGMIGTVIALGIWNSWGFKLRGEFSTQKFRLKKIDIIQAAIANSIFLVVLFAIEDLMASIKQIPTFGVALLGFAAVTFTLLVLFAVYNKFKFKLGAHINGKHREIMGISVVATAIIAGIYEAIILPTMALMFTLPLPTIYSFVLTGMVAGVVGGIAGTLIFNQISGWIKPWIELQ
jgi:hypothetical protein